MKRILLLAGLVAATAAMGAGVIRHKDRIAMAWEEWRYPAPKGAPGSLMGEEILKEHDRQLARQVQEEYARIRAKINAARLRGNRTDFLEPKMSGAVNLARSGQFQQALILLNIIEMQIPRPRERMVPAQLGAVEAPPEKIKWKAVGGGKAGSAKSPRHRVKKKKMVQQ